MLLRALPPPPFLVDRERFRNEVGVSVQDESRGDVDAFVLGEANSLGYPKASKSAADVATDALDFVRDHEKSLALPALEKFAADPPIPGVPDQVVWQGEGTPNADSPCSKVKIRLELSTTRHRGIPTYVRRTCVSGRGRGPSFVGRTLPRTGAMGRVLFFCRGSEIARGDSTFVDQYGDVYLGTPDDPARRPQFLLTLPPRDVEAAMLDAIAASRILRTQPIMNYVPPLVAPVPDTGQFAKFCVAYVPGLGTTSTLGITEFEERGAATLPIVHLHEWLDSYGL